MDEQNNGINVDLTEMQENEIAEELTKEEPVVEEHVDEPVEETKDEASIEQPVEEVKEEPDVAEAEATEKTEDAKKVEEPTLEVTEETKEEKPENEDVKQEDDKPEEIEDKKDEDKEELEKVKAELTEIKAIREEEKNIKEFEAQMQADEFYMDKVRGHIAEQLTRALKDIGVDLNTTMEELEKANPDKAARARQFLEEAHRIEAYEQQKREQARNERLQNIVFQRAGRLFDKYKLTDEEGDVAAETFVNILHEVGLKNLDDDLVAKVELAVGRTRLLVDRAKDVVEEVKDIAKEVADIVTDVTTPAPKVNPDEEKVKEELKAEEAEPKEEPKQEPKIDISAFEEGATTGVVAPTAEVDVLAELDKLSTTRERVAFYAEHAKEIERALAEKYNKRG